MAGVYQLPDQYAGKNLNQINDTVTSSGGYSPGVGDLAKILGISPSQTLSKGQMFNIPDSGSFGNFQGSGYQRFLNSSFNPLTSEQVAANQADAATTSALKSAQAIRQFNIDSAQPQIATMQQGKTDLSSRYSDLLATIRGDQTQAVNKATTNTANELGRRGITGGGVYDTELQQSQQNAGQPFEGLYATTSTGQTQDLNTINNQIASLQSGNPAESLSSGLQIGGLSQHASALAAQIAQNQAQNDLQKRQLELDQQAQNFAQKYITIPGYGIYNPSANNGSGVLYGGLNGVTTNGLLTYTGH